VERAVLEIETRAFRAWPADEVEPLGGWALRAAGGLTRRANSVWPGPDAPAAPALDAGALAARIARVERFYASRRLAPRFQLFPAAAPADLDAELARRGWIVEAPVSVQVADAARVAQAGDGRELPVSLAHAPTAGWWSVAGERSRSAGAEPRFRALLGRLAGRVGYALVERAGEPVAAGLGVVDEGWLGVFSMSTRPAHRRRGAARAVLAALAGFALERGAPRIYLQVERDNAPALALYARAGFAEHHGYHYRTHPAGAAAGRLRVALRPRPPG